MSSLIYNAIGIFGDVLILIAYSLLQLKKLSAETVAYSFLNLAGAALILFSLFFSWNLPAVIIEISWVMISVYGLLQAVHSKLYKQNARK
jgi:hypothetical protein